MKDLILLHGALGASAQFKSLSKLLEENFNVYSFSFDGHGGNPINTDYSIDHFSKNLKQFILDNGIERPNIFGYSMGGYVAIYSIANGLEVNKLMTLGTKFDWTPEGSAKEVKMLNPEIIQEKVPAFASFQEKLHTPLDWKKVMRETANMMLIMGGNPPLSDAIIQNVSTPILCCVGGKDSMVSITETDHVSNVLPTGDIFVFEEFEHPLERIDQSILAEKIIDYFK